MFVCNAFSTAIFEALLPGAHWYQTHLAKENEEKVERDRECKDMQCALRAVMDELRTIST